MVNQTLKEISIETEKLMLNEIFYKNMICSLIDGFDYYWDDQRQAWIKVYNLFGEL